MLNLLWVGLGGFVGAIARYSISLLVHRHYGGAFPAGTLTVNVLGCLIIGALMSFVEGGQLSSVGARSFLTVGLLGALTTFSTFGYETVELLRGEAVGLALASVAANVVLGVSAVWLGREAVQLISG